MTDLINHNKQQSTSTTTSVNKKRKIADVDADAHDGVTVTGKAGQLDLPAEIAAVDNEEDEYAGEYGCDDDDFEGLLETEELEQSGHAVLSPNQPIVNCSSQNTAPLLSQSAFPPLSQSASQIPRTRSEEDEDALILKQEAALAKKYGIIRPLPRPPIVVDDHANRTPSMSVPAASFYGPSSSSAAVSVSFTSGRGKSIAAPSAKAMLKAQRIFETAATAADEASTQDTPSRHIHDFPYVQVEPSPVSIPRMHHSKPHIDPLRFVLQKQQAQARRLKAVAAKEGARDRDKDKAVLPRYGMEQEDDSTMDMVTVAADHDDNEHESRGEGVNIENVPRLSFPGLTTGGGKRLEPPSREKIEAASHRLANGSMHQVTDSQVDGRDDGQHDVQMNAEPSLSVTATSLPGLTTGGGRRIEPPTREKIEAVSLRLASTAMHEEESERDTAPTAHESAPLAQLALFTSGSGKAVSMPSPEKVAQATAKLDAVTNAPVPDDQNGSGLYGSPEDLSAPYGNEDYDEPTFRPASQVAKQLFSTGRGSAVAMPSEAAIARVESMMQHEEAVNEQASPSSPFRPVLASRTNLQFSPLRPNALSSPAKQSGPNEAPKSPFVPKIVSKPFKPPSAISYKSNRPSTPGRQAINQTFNTPNSQNSQFRRLDQSLSMIPRNTPSARASGLAGKGSFKTPFKNGARPSENILQSLRKETRGIKPDLAAVIEASQAGDPAKPKSSKSKPTSRQSAFNLYCDQPRISLIDAGLQPGLHIDDLIDAGLPNDILFMNLHKAADYKFPGNEGAEAAYDDLVYYSNCTHVTQAWVNNHYALIIWKLAGMIRAKPSLRPEYWKFEVVCDQLKYRYEREVNQAHRSCIKRIQERDSPPSLPMTLVVSNVFYEERPVVQEMGTKPDPSAEPQMEQIAIGMELSDGWYRIKANLDEAMYRAHFFGQLSIGTKIHVQSAKLDSGSEGGEPLEAYESSSLIVSGNSTCRAHWAAKLGFRNQRRPAVCAFRSLTPDGGLVPYVDVVITKIYPLGYKGEYKEGESQDVWNDVEERERQKEWEKLRQSAQLDVMKEQHKLAANIFEVQQRLQDALQTASERGSSIKAEPLPGAKLDDFVDIFEAIEAEPSKAPHVLRGLSKDTLQETLQYAQRQMESLQTDAAQDMQKELDQRCPPRIARCFCIVRVRDAHERDGEGGRECQLNISDPSKLGENFLAEGKRYLISKLLPGRITGWSPPKAKAGEIFLNTRFDSRWQALSGRSDD